MPCFSHPCGEPRVRTRELVKLPMYILLLSLAVLAGCTPAAVEQMTIKGTIKQTAKAYAICAAPILADPKYAPIALHVPLKSVMTATIEQMESTVYPTPADIVLVSDLRDRMAPCQQAVVAALEGVPGNLAAPLQNFYTDEDQGIIMLSQGHLTWGQFVQGLRAASIDQQQQMLVAANQLDSQLQAANELEAAQQAQAFQSFADYAQRQQAIEAANRPINTVCHTFMGQTTCTSD